MELIEESTDLTVGEGVMSPPNGSTKPAPPHVPPRIDPDMYQADVPDWCPQKEGFICVSLCLVEPNFYCKSTFFAESESDLPDSGLHSKSVYSAEYNSSPEVQGTPLIFCVRKIIVIDLCAIIFLEFLTAVRNLLDPVRPKGQHFWAASQSTIPLETDVIALEYLSSYNYDVEKAMFNLYCELGRGKGEFPQVLISQIGKF